MFGEKISKFFLCVPLLAPMNYHRKIGKKWGCMRKLGSGGLLEAELWIFENRLFFQKMAIFQNFDDFLQPN